MKAAPVGLTHIGRLHDCVFVLLLLHKVLELISSYRCVKAWLNGHNHAGAYAEYQGIHFITFKGMVDTEENSYATVQLHGNQLRVTGFGREGNLALTLKGDY